MALSANQKEEAYIQAFIKTLKDLAKNGDQLNGVQLKGVEGMTKWMTQMSNTNTIQKTTLKTEKMKKELGEKELKTREALKKADEHLVKLRHNLNIQQEREHGQQVRRNINLRHNMDNFNDGLNFVKKSLTGGFGFQAAMNKTITKMAGMTRSYQEHQVATDQLKESSKETDKAYKKLQLLTKNKAPKDKIKEAQDAYDIAFKKREGDLGNVAHTKQQAKPTLGKMEPIFKRLGKVGDFLGKKAIPIGLGLGVAGILMSVIVKAFSASPLFGAMMKLMKFMVTLVLMPIGTFFGALLRPILIMLLRKFIVPFYSHWMPVLMDLGTEIGNWITELTPDKIATAISNFLTGKPTDGDADGDGIPDEDDNKFDENPFDFFTEMKDWWEEEKRRKQADYEAGNVGAFDASGSSGDNSIINPNDIEKAAPDADMNKTDDKKPLDVEATLAGGERQPDGSILLPNGDVIKDGVTYKNADEQSSSTNTSQSNHTWGDGSNDDFGNYQPPVPEESREMTEAEKDRELMFTDPQAWQAKQDKMAADKKQAEQKIWMDKQAKAEELRAEQAERSKIAREEAAAALAKPNTRNIDAVIAAQAARNAEQEKVETENTRFANTPSAGKLSSSLNAGANVGAAMTKNASKKHTMGSSQRGSDIMREYWASRGVTMAAEGFDGMVNSPTMFMAGEAGAEHVKVTPNGQGGGGSNITINIQNMNAGDDDLRKLKKTILEVIQQSSANRGRL